jgi:Arc/MetJ-type ribon-helix-helix transcriptional regulator
VGAVKTKTPTTADAECMTYHYADRMAQLVARVDDSLVAEIDDLVATGVLASRSEAMRVGLQELVDRHRRRIVGERITDAYRKRPQTDEELAGLDASTRALVEEEPW